MKIKSITAFPDTIRFTFTDEIHEILTICTYVPLVCGNDSPDFVPGKVVFPGRAVSCQTAAVQGEYAEIPRFCGDFDQLVCRFSVTRNGIPIPGVCYVTDFSEDFSRWNYDPPIIDRPVGTWVTALPEDQEYLRFGYMMTEIDMAWILTLHPEEDDIAHSFNGRTYYFRRDMMELYEAFSKPYTDRGIPFLIRFINRFHYQNHDASEELFSLLRHPGYEPDFPAVEMSAFNLRTEDGFSMYCAALDFLFARYASPDSPYGWSVMTDIGNEVNSPGMWHNMGPMPCEGFMEEYTVSLRLAWLLSHKYYAHHRVNISLEHHFNVADGVGDSLHFYPAAQCLAELIRICRRDGDFDWGVAAHPYPSDVLNPAFWEDKDAVFSLDTPKITLKNMEVWPALLSSPDYLYRGQPRHVIFDEQGFHTNDDDPDTENKGAYAFVLAWLKLRRQPGIELLLLHRYADMPDDSEYSLKLGLRRALGYGDERHLLILPGAYKKVCYAIRDMDTPAQEQWIREARDFIGPERFDALLDPMIDIDT